MPIALKLIKNVLNVVMIEKVSVYVEISDRGLTLELEAAILKNDTL